MGVTAAITRSILTVLTVSCSLGDGRLAVRWLVGALTRAESTDGKRFAVVAFMRPDMALPAPMPVWCEHAYDSRIFACASLGGDGLWVTPRQDVWRFAEMAEAHRRCTSADAPARLENTRMKNWERVFERDPGCCGPPEALLQHALARTDAPTSELSQRTNPVGSAGKRADIKGWSKDGFSASDCKCCGCVPGGFLGCNGRNSTCGCCGGGRCASFCTYARSKPIGEPKASPPPRDKGACATLSKFNEYFLRRVEGSGLMHESVTTRPKHTSWSAWERSRRHVCAVALAPTFADQNWRSDQCIVLGLNIPMGFWLRELFGENITDCKAALAGADEFMRAGI